MSGSWCRAVLVAMLLVSCGGQRQDGPGGDLECPAGAHLQRGWDRLSASYEAWCVDADGLRQGLGRRYDEDGRLFFEATFKDDKVNGLITEYYADGGVKARSTLKDDELNGPATEYDENGALEVQETYVAGKKRERIVWRQGRPESQTTYRDGSPTGIARSWQPNGKIRAEGVLRRGKRDGVWLEYDERGVLVGVELWKDGEAVPQDEVRAELERALQTSPR